jgi:hypothetical protein
MRQVYVLSPSCHNRIRLYASMPMLFKISLKSLAHFTQRVAFPRWRITYKSVRGTALRGCFSTGFLGWILRPKVITALGTKFPNVPYFFKEWKAVLVFSKLFQSLNAPISVRNSADVEAAAAAYPSLKPSRRPATKLPMNGKRDTAPTIHETA